MAAVCSKLRVAGCLLGTLLVAGCATHRPPATAQADVPHDSTLETFVEKVRQLSSVARPPRSTDAGTIEQRDPELLAARLQLTSAPTADNHRLVANAYARLGVLDAAYDQFQAVLRLAPNDAAAYDGLARIWRDWGFPHLGLTDAYRAVYYAPDSPTPQNTLGTLLLKMGKPADARLAFERALALDPRAAYVLNNLCYADLLTANQQSAIERCRAAIAVQPELTAAHNNLALAYTASGDMTAAVREFSLAGSLASARYNMGMALMATRHFDAAALAFDEAAMVAPSATQARARARQARTMAARPAAGQADDATR